MTDPTDRIARAICREKCAFMGEPPCFDKSIFGEEPWPNPYCDEPGCHALAAAVVAEIGKDTGGQAVTPTEHLARAMLAEICRADNDGWINPYIDDKGVLRCAYADGDQIEPARLAEIRIDGRVDLIALAKAAIAAIHEDKAK